MQVKKFEAPTMQEALETIKRELGPEAIILQTKKHKRGFGLMSRASVEVTAAISDRSLSKKQFAETRLPEQSKEAVRGLPAEKQASLYDKYMDRHVQKSSKKSDAAEAANKRLTATRYIDIDPQEAQERAEQQARAQARAARSVQQTRSSQPQVQASPQAAGATQKMAYSDSVKPGYGMGMEEEIKHLKRMIEEMKVAQEEAGPSSGAQALLSNGSFSSGALQDAYEQLVLNGVDKRYAMGIIKKAGFELGTERSKNPDEVLDEVATEIVRTTEVMSPLRNIAPGSRAGRGPSVVALIGPTGVGKTTTVAKIASDALLKKNLRVGLINLDSYKVAAVDQLATYAKILNVPFRSATSAADLVAAIQDFQSLDLVLIDTTGRSQRDPASLGEMHSILSSIAGVQTELVVSATTRDAELYDTANRFSVFKPQGLIVSKLDEATIYGSIYNVSQKVKLPLLYFTTGQRVPEDFEEASPERVVALIMEL